MEGAVAPREGPPAGQPADLHARRSGHPGFGDPRIRTDHAVVRARQERPPAGSRRWHARAPAGRLCTPRADGYRVDRLAELGSAPLRPGRAGGRRGSWTRDRGRGQLRDRSGDPHRQALIGMMTTGQGAWWATCCDTDPSNRPLKPPRPRLLTTSRSAPCARSVSTWAADPSAMTSWRGARISSAGNLAAAWAITALASASSSSRSTIDIDIPVSSPTYG